MVTNILAPTRLLRRHRQFVGQHNTEHGTRGRGHEIDRAAKPGHHLPADRQPKPRTARLLIAHTREFFENQVGVFCSDASSIVLKVDDNAVHFLHHADRQFRLLGVTVFPRIRNEVDEHLTEAIQICEQCDIFFRRVALDIEM